MIPAREGGVRLFDRELLAAEPDYHGVVEAVHRHAALVRPLGKGRLLTLLCPSRPLVPCGLQIPWDVPPAVGNRVRRCGRSVTMGETSFKLEGEGVCLSLAEAPPAVAPRTALKRLSRLPAQAGEDRDPWQPCLLARLGDLMKALRRLPPDGERVDHAVRRLVGLGAGSTPSGDDLLVGVGAGAWRWLRPERLQCYLQALEGVPLEATTLVSREMLQHAARGAFPAPLGDFVRALTAPELQMERLRQALQDLLRVGARSGTEWRAGLAALVHTLAEGEDL